MADLSDVENAIVETAVATLYPEGLTQASIVGTTCRIYRGWPTPNALNSDLTAGIVNVTVFPSTSPDEVPDPYFDVLYSTASPATLLATVNDDQVTFSGIAAVGQIVGLLVDQSPFIYVVNAGDSPEIIAATFMTRITQTRIASSSGPTINIPGTTSLIARVATSVTLSRGIRRQRKEIQIICWCPSPGLRDSVAIMLDNSFANSSFLGLADGTMAHARYVSTQLYDQSQNAMLYRRDLCYKFEYTIISNTLAPIMIFGDLIENGRTHYL